MNQMTIDFTDIPDDIAEGFWHFHKQNPEIYARLLEMTRDMVRRGKRRLGMGMLFEVLRWEYFLSVDTDEPFRLNNNYRAFYARLLEQNNPDLRGVFTKRKSISDEEIAA